MSDVALHWRLGIQFGIPVCCCAHFCLDRALGRTVSVVRWRQIADWHTPLLHDRPWVPCGVLHGGYSPHSPQLRLAKILAFQLTTLLPGARASWIRERSRTPGPLWLTTDPARKSAISHSGGNGQLWWAHH